MQRALYLVAGVEFGSIECSLCPFLSGMFCANSTALTINYRDKSLTQRACCLHLLSVRAKCINDLTVSLIAHAMQSSTSACLIH